MTSTTPRTAILLLNLPPKTFVGIDLVSFNSSPNFHGIIDLPSGLHCLYTGTDATLSIRHCHWLKFNTQSAAPQTYVFQWSHETESLDHLQPSGDTAQPAIRSIPSLRGRGLVDYVALQEASTNLQAKQAGVRVSSKSTDGNSWAKLCSHISVRTLNRILNPTDQSLPVWTLSSISSAPTDAEAIPGLTSEEAEGVLHDNHSSIISLAAINLRQTWPEESRGRDRTEKARDRSWYLGHIIDSIAQVEDGDAQSKRRQLAAEDLLGELQFCFIMVLTLANYSCLEQWKRILSVVFTCQAALSDIEGFFVEVVKVLHTQLMRVDDVEGGLFEMSDEAGSAWLRGLLKTFRARVDEVFPSGEQDAGVSLDLAQLEQWLREVYDWADDSSLLKRGMVDLEDGERVELQMDGLDEEEETGEYAPVVVEI